MLYQYSIHQYDLQFNKPAKTSRNTFVDKTVYYIKLYYHNQPKIQGIGEAAPLALLSIDAVDDFENHLYSLVSQFCASGQIDPQWTLSYPSIVFALETALLDLKNKGNRVLYRAAMPDNTYNIKINGLVWMNEADTMLHEAHELVKKGFDCIKFKVGALDFDSECRMLESFRKKHSTGNILLRLDANGAFHPQEVKEQLKELARFEPHSIEQPVKPEEIELLAKLSKDKMVPIALDESLIGVGHNAQKSQLLKNIKPQFIVLKPTLIGGLAETTYWIKEGEKLGIHHWITSALESNIGLNAIAQFSVLHPNTLHQGLGTGSLFKNNIGSPLSVKNGYLTHHKTNKWDIPDFLGI